MRVVCFSLLLLSCARASGPVLFDTLVGVELPLLPSPQLRVVVAGQIFERPAEVAFDVGAAMTLVTKGCIDEPMVRSARVRVPDPFGDDDVYPVTRLVGLTLGGRRLTPMEAGLVSGEACAVVVGADRLSSTALIIDPARRLVHFVASRSRAEWSKAAEVSGGEAQVLELTRDPAHDWPLLAARVTQGAANLTAPFMFSTRERVTRVSEQALSVQGFTSMADLIERLGLPTKAAQSMSGMPLDLVELAPQVGARGVTVALSPQPSSSGVVGVLAADVWGRFQTTIDVEAGVLVLQRPRVFVSGERVQCERAGVTSDEACFELSSLPLKSGVVFTATVWRPLPRGARLYLDVPGAGCRVGVTFDRGDRGRNTQHVVPWSRLSETMPACAKSLAAAKDITLGLFEEGPLEQCPGVCAFVHELRTGQVSCECQGGPLGVFPEANRGVLEQLEKSLKPVHEPEPGDPD